MKQLLLFLFVAARVNSYSQAFSGSISCSPPNCVISCDNPTVSLMFMPTPFSASFSVNGWSNASTSNPATYSTAGVASVTVTNNGNTYVFSKVININNVPPSFTIAAVQPTCGSCCNGQITVTASGGANTYSLNGTSQGSSNSYSNLCNGKQVICVKSNQSGCFKCDSVELDFQSGIKEYISIASCKLYPNPANEKITFSSQSLIKDIMMTDVLGKTVRSMRDINQITCEIDLGSLHPGIYFLIATGPGWKHTKKIIKQ